MNINKGILLTGVVSSDGRTDGTILCCNFTIEELEALDADGLAELYENFEEENNCKVISYSGVKVIDNIYKWAKAMAKKISKK